MGQKLQRSVFAQTLKQKYPVYADIPDEELVTKVLEQHPIYRESVESSEEALGREAAAVGVSGPAPLPSGPQLPTPPAPKQYTGVSPAAQAADAWRGAEALVRGVSLEGVPAGVQGDDPSEKLVQFIGAMGPIVGGTVLGGPAGAALAGGVQGAAGSLGRSAQEEFSAADAENRQINLRNAMPKAAVKALGHGALGATMATLPMAFGKGVLPRLVTGVPLGAGLAAAVPAVEQFAETGGVDIHDPELQAAAKMGAAVGMAPGVGTAALRMVRPGAPRAAAPRAADPAPMPPPPPDAPVGDPLFDRLRQLAQEAQEAPAPAAAAGPDDLHRQLNLLVREQAEVFDRMKGMAEGSPEHAAAAAQMDDLLKRRDAMIAQREAALAAAPQAAAPTPQAAAGGGSRILSTAGWTQTGEALGSNPGGFFTAPDGAQWYVKVPPGGMAEAIKRAQNEVLASELYRAAGVEVPEVRIAQHGGRPAVASRVIPNLQRATPEGLGGDPRFGRGAAADAWLANTDAAGTEFDNVMQGPQGPVRVDLGGSLLFEPAGTPRQLADVASELDAFRQPENPMAALLGRQPEEALQEGAQRLAGVSDDQIHQIIERSGYGNAAERSRLANTLISRRDDVVRRLSGQAALEDATRGMSIEPAEGVPVNASGESAASAEALSRQAGMAARGEQFAVQRGGQVRPLIGPEAVDYTPRPGETFGLLKDGQFTPLQRGERGAISAGLAARMGGAAIGGPIGAATFQDEEGRPSTAGFFLGAVGGAALGKIAYKAALTRGARQTIIQGMHTSPGVTEALKRTAPRFRDDLSQTARALANSVSDAFVPYGALKRNFALAGADGAERPAVEVLDRFASRLYELPTETVQQLHHIVDPLKDSDDYTQLFQILRLRRDLEERMLDTVRRTRAFQTLRDYRAAKRSGDSQATFLRTRLQRSRRYLKPLDPFIRKGMDPANAQATLANLLNDAQRNRPHILEAMNRYRQTMVDIGKQLEAEGFLDATTLGENQEYFPDYVMSYLSGRLSVGGTKGLHPKRAGFIKPRGIRGPDVEIWNDLLGPVAKRVLDQKVVLERGKAAAEILQAYDPVRQGRVTPQPGRPLTAREVTKQANDGLTYAHWSFRDPSNPNARYHEGYVPMQLHDELVRRHAAEGPGSQALKKINSAVKGFLIRGSAGGFLLQNLAGDVQSLYAGTPWEEWHRLPPAQVKAFYASTLQAMHKDPALAPIWAQSARRLAQQGEKAGLGTAAAAAEVTEAVIREPRFIELAASPVAGVGQRLGDAAVGELRSAVGAFDTTRQILENTNRLAGFIERTARGIPDEQAGKVVKYLIGNYDPNFFTLAESKPLMRGFLIPFYAFYKNNTRNWLPGVAKEVAGTAGELTRTKPEAARTIAAKWARIAPFSLAALAWNHYAFPEAEATLSPWQRDQFHVLVPNALDPWNEEQEEWNLVYIGFPTPANMAARSVGLGGAPNRLVHALRGTGSMTIEEELQEVKEQALDFWSSLLNPVVTSSVALATGKDWLSGRTIRRPGQNALEGAAEHFSHFVQSMPFGRQAWRAGREGASPEETAEAFLLRMAVGGTIQGVDVDANTAKAVRRLVSEGRRVGQEKSKDRRVRKMEGKDAPFDFTEDELRGMIGTPDAGGPRLQWQALAADLLKLHERATADLPPSAPGAAERAAGSPIAAVPSRRGPNAIPTAAHLTSLGPDAALKEFFATLGVPASPGFAPDTWRGAMADIADQLKRQDARWDIPAAIMRVLIQEPRGEEDVEILKRLQGLAGAKARQRQ